jgi:hypothetical protein
VTRAPEEVFTTNEHARRGTAAHTVCQLLLDGETVPETLTVDGEVIEVDDEMLEHTRAYVRLVEVLRHDTPFHGVEAPVSLQWLLDAHGIDNIRLDGTTDFWAYDPIARIVFDVDFKYGAGVAVSAVNNTQARLYGLDLMHRYPDAKKLRVVIVQPRAGDEPIRYEDISREDLETWAQSVVIPAVRRIGAGDTSENPGDGKHCRWCPRAATCSALYETVCASAAEAFSDPVPAPVPTLSSERLAEILDKCDVIEGFVKEARIEAQRRLEAGDAVPGFKLVQKRAMRRWRDASIVEHELDQDLYSAIPRDDLFTQPELRSPAQLEKALKRHGFDAAIVETWVSRESSGVTLAREEDKRMKVTSAASLLFSDAAE